MGRFVFTCERSKSQVRSKALPHLPLRNQWAWSPSEFWQSVRVVSCLLLTLKQGFWTKVGLPPAQGSQAPDVSHPSGVSCHVKTPRRGLCLAKGRPGGREAMEVGTCCRGQCRTKGRVLRRPSVALHRKGPLMAGAAQLQRQECLAVGMVSGGHLSSLQESNFLNSVGTWAR